jgi:catechol 2,3-dioxygenase-like lactoylglutathione lyase family enzyme
VSTVAGPDFIALQVRNIERAAEFYERELGLTRAPGPPHAVVFATQPIAFAVRDPEPISTVDSPASAWRYGCGPTTPKPFMTDSPSTA